MAESYPLNMSLVSEEGEDYLSDSFREMKARCIRLDLHLKKNWREQRHVCLRFAVMITFCPTD